MPVVDVVADRIRPIEFVVDTDIGSDVDDLLALAVILGSPDLAATGVTTVYGDVSLRARLVAAAFAAAGAPRPVVAAGRERTRSGRDVWWAGHEGSSVVGLDEFAFDADADAIGLLAESSTVVPIGPLTNVAAALERPLCAIRSVVMMGGAFDARTEHNIRSDVDAAEVVFGSGVEIVTVGIEQTERLRFREADLVGLAGPLGALVESEVRRFWSFSAQSWNTPHDPIALIMLARPELFAYARGTISVLREAADGIDAGRTVFTPDPAGSHRIVTDYDVPAVAAEIRSRIRVACAGG